jgi:hypothetical protein
VSWLISHVEWLLLAAVGLGFLITVFWTMEIGFTRGLMAGSFRLLWLLPIFLAFFPRTQTEELPRSMTLRTLHVLSDDSESMGFANGNKNLDPESPAARSNAALATLNAECERLGCQPKVTLLSQEDQLTTKGFTPLSRALENWVFRLGNEPWIVLSDGGDYRPTEAWPPSLARTGVGSPAPRGLIYDLSQKDQSNIWISQFNIPPFSFDSKPVFVDVTLRRTADRVSREERIQTQVLTGESAVATINAEFTAGKDEVLVQVSVPPLTRGQHLLTVAALSPGDESAVWDNSVNGEVEVLPNTVGVLHLLGSPSWDGRFLRRYLKSEPKYDLISFFILRDPWDSQQYSERELSLIPFPVERLFKEELPNFRVIVIQNFTLFQFLSPQFQSNLVDFVKNGGGLLFIGGPRALLRSDLASSPLSQILPFNSDGSSNVDMSGALGGFPMGFEMSESKPDLNGPYHDPDMSFKIALANPDPVERALANVYDDWEKYSETLSSVNSLKGLHHMEQVQFKKEKHTPLLDAVTSTGQKIPLAVASYPGKGRAIWLFSDSFYQLAMAGGTPREAYNSFMEASITWLMRQDLKKPVAVKNFRILGDKGDYWSASLVGPAARYFSRESGWQVTACGAVIKELNVERSATDEWTISGSLPARVAGGQRCALEVSGEHPAFGSVRAQMATVIPQTFADREIGGSPKKLQDLAKHTLAELVTDDAGLTSWLERQTGQDGVALPSRLKTTRNFFWALEQPWFFLCLLALPLEVLVRRWHQFFGRRRAQ